MKYIGEYVELMDEEIDGAKCYAEKYVESKAKGDSNWANRWKEMSNQELQHAMWIHDLATSEIEKLKAVFTPPQEMQDMWDNSHKQYVERVAWVKQMLTM